MTTRIPRSPLLQASTRDLAVALLCGWLSLAGCSDGPSLSLNYASTAKDNYELAKTEFRDDDYEEAIRYAEFVRVRFPFSRYAVEAELVIARSRFGNREYLSAQDAFRQFARLHPTHEHVKNGWIAYMVAVSAYMAAPETTNILLPKHYQRDQSVLEEALSALQTFFDRYPTSPRVKDAKTLRDDIQRRLLEHELYVAEYYLNRDLAESAIGRLEAASRRYPGLGFDANVMFLLGVTYLRVEEVELARDTFAELQMRHPEHSYGAQAKVYLQHIYDRYGPADPNRTRPDRSLPTPRRPTEPNPQMLPRGATSEPQARAPNAGARPTVALRSRR